MLRNRSAYGLDGGDDFGWIEFAFEFADVYGTAPAASAASLTLKHDRSYRKVCMPAEIAKILLSQTPRALNGMCVEAVLCEGESHLPSLREA